MKKSDLKTFIKFMLLMTALLMLLVGVPAYLYYGLSVIGAGLIAVVLTFSNACIGFYFVDRYFGASMNEFMKKVFGSMGVRLLVLGLILVGLLGFTKIHKVGFTVSLFISYILFSAIEIYFFNQKASNSNSSR